MEHTFIRQYDTVVVGTGAAGYNAACRICESGKKSVCIVTEGVQCGTSRNTGSDKQTYYKLGLGGSAPDSVRAMTETLFENGCVDGDTALCEAALSARCFYNLCEAGVPFPCNRYGEFVGYKTDHDPFARATSAGPLTSKFMTEALQKKADDYAIPVLDRLLAVEVLTKDGSVCGLLCLSLDTHSFVVLQCNHIVLATGGPAGIYADSVYPTCHNGSTGLAIDAGAELQNMTEWQYGLASVEPRWNVSGTYMQVLPRFVSIDEDGAEHEFLSEFFSNAGEALSTVFLKGYQWPFDIKKVKDGSSVIDLLVYRECVLRGRRVYLDFTKNPFGLSKIDYDSLSTEAREYLSKADACFGTPIDRLEKMNAPAIDLYRGKGVDITKEYLEIALCAQHNNGGIAVDRWWQTKVDGLFAVGECAGTHGIARPGGSALNAGQVGSLRAAQFISASAKTIIDDASFACIANEALARHTAICQAALANKSDNVAKELLHVRREMSACGGAIRNVQKMREMRDAIHHALADFSKLFGISSPLLLEMLYRLRDTLTVQDAVLTAMIDYANVVAFSRGSALYTDPSGILCEGLEELFRYTEPDANAYRDLIQTVSRQGDAACTAWRPVRPIPSDDDFFENVWRSYRQNQNID